MSGLKRIVQEIHRRSLWQVLGLYLGASWVAIQIVNEIGDSVGLPDWVPAGAVVLLIVGFPIVVATAFVQHGMRGGPARSRTVTAGEVGAEPSSGGEAAPRGTEDTHAPGAGATGAVGPDGRVRSSDGVHHRLFTWRNALVGGALAFALLGVVAAGYMAMRVLGIGPAGTLVAKGLLEERSPILLADFASDDASLARAATEAFRVDLSQSEVVRLAEPAFVSEALRRMERPPDTTLDRSLARELAVREGIPAVMAGEIHQAGERYILTAELLEAERGQVLVSHRETASEAAGVVDAIDRLSNRLRERIGEPLRSLNRTPPLERVTTADLEALRLYSEAVHEMDVRGNDDRGIGLLEEVVRRDTAFAMAWRKLGVGLSNRGEDRARAVGALTRAYELRDRLTPKERYWAMASYFQQGVDEPEQAIAAYENLLELDPDDNRALNNIAVAYGRLGDRERAVEHWLRAIEADTLAATISLSNVTSALMALGRLDEAGAQIERWSRLTPEDPRVDMRAAQLVYLKGDLAGARERIETIRAETTGNLFWRAATSADLAELNAVEGKLARAETYWEDQASAEMERDLPGEALDAALELVWLDLVVRRDTARAQERLERVLTAYTLEEIPPLDRDYLELAALHAAFGEAGRARAFLTRWQEEVPEDLRFEPFGVRGEIALAEGRFEEAASHFHALREEAPGCDLCGLGELGRVFMQAGIRDSAVVYFERFLEQSPSGRWGWDAFDLAETLTDLGRLYDEQGDLENAARHYAGLVELWSDADPELQPRVRAAQERLQAIVAERG